MKVYASICMEPNNEDSNTMLLNALAFLKTLKKTYSYDEYCKFVVEFHDHMREEMKLPNKLFAIAYNKDGTKAKLVFFDKEPDGKYYKVFKDKEKRLPYIEISEDKICLNIDKDRKYTSI